MPEAYDLHEARFIQYAVHTSAADATSILASAVPAGKVRTYIGGGAYPSASETKVYHWAITANSGASLLPVTTPVSIALTSGRGLPLVTEGMEIKLYPGEQLIVYRDSATAGSTMTLILRFIESDLPFYAYEEPQNKIVKKLFQRGSVYRSSGGISERSAPGRVPGSEGSGGGGNPQPV